MPDPDPVDYRNNQELESEISFHKNHEDLALSFMHIDIYLVMVIILDLLIERRLNF